MNGYSRHYCFLAFVVLALALIGCDSASLSGPPQFRPGRDECRECGMMIDDLRSAAALLVERDGRREHVLFDDIGCLLDFELSIEPPMRVVDRFVRDYGTREWVNGSAWYVLGDPERIRTPMASGMAAYADEPSARAAATETGGRLLDHAALLKHRVQWKANRRASTRPVDG